jgi:hypothetical protein
MHTIILGWASNSWDWQQMESLLTTKRVGGSGACGHKLEKDHYFWRLMVQVQYLLEQTILLR